MILMNDFKAEPRELHEQMLAATRRVLESGWYVLGTECKTFEQAWAARCGVAHGVGVANGMDAIEIALRCLDIGPGDEVITTPMTAFATVLAVLRVGAGPVLAEYRSHDRAARSGEREALSVEQDARAAAGSSVWPGAQYGGVAGHLP